MKALIFIDPDNAVHTATGHGLDMLGALDGINVRRHQEPPEPDAEYRARLVKAFEEFWASFRP
jgi:hypothetical protein